MRERCRVGRIHKKPKRIFPKWRRLKRLFNKRIRRNSNITSGSYYRKANFNDWNLV